MSNPNPPAAALVAPHRVRWFGLIALAAYAFFLLRISAGVAGGSDSSGYLNSARLFAAGRLLAELRAPAEFGPRESVDAMHFLPQGFFPFREPGRLTPTYPTGLPLHFAAAGTVLGWDIGPLAVMLAAALGAVLLMYACGRELGLAAETAGAGAALLAAFPVFLFTSIQPLSDTPAATWTLAALYAALRARRDTRWAVAAGGAFAIAVLVRPTNLLFAPALLVLLGARLGKLAAFVAGGLPGAAWLAWYNHQLYGSAGRSGYGDIFAAFAWSYGGPTALHFAKWLALLLPAAVLVLPVWALRRREQRRPLLALALGFGAITGLYLFYEVSHEVWWCLRFILPAVPPLLLAALLGFEQLVAAFGPRARRAAVIGLALWGIGLGAWWTPRLDVFLMKTYEEAYPEGARLALRTLPRDALVLSNAFSGTLYFYGEFPVLRWDQIEGPRFADYATRARAAGRPVCALLFDWEEADAFKRCPGDWRQVGAVRNVRLWQLGPAPAGSTPPAAPAR